MHLQTQIPFTCYYQQGSSHILLALRISRLDVKFFHSTNSRRRNCHASAISQVSGSLVDVLFKPWLYYTWENTSAAQ